MALAGAVNIVLSTLTLIAGIMIAAFLLLEAFSTVFKKKLAFWECIKSFFSKHALLFAFLLALVSTLGSLTYSEILKYAPCKLCWYQRIAMYPQIIILGMALWKKDFKVKNYAVPMSIIGGIIAVYQYITQRISSAVCTGEAVNCAFSYVFHYGYITIPMMAMTAFVAIIILLLLKRGKRITKSQD